MPRYLIERTFTDGLSIPLTDESERICRTVDAPDARITEVGVLNPYFYRP